MQTRPIDEATFSFLSHDRVFSRKRSGKNRREEMTPRMRSFRRVLFAVAAIGGSLALAYALWTPGLVVKDGRNDKGTNGIWLAHGWLGGDEWFIRNAKTGELSKYRSKESIGALFQKLTRHGVRDVFPHLCPVSPTGQLPPTNPEQVERFLDAAGTIRVFPWIGGPSESNALISEPEWRAKFASEVAALLARHPRLAGVHVNIEPLRSGNVDFLTLLDQLSAILPRGRLISVAAYPPPTRWHPVPEVHWEEPYFREVARRCDQLAVMMYDAGQRFPKTYQKLMSDWTDEVLVWSEGKPVLLGVPTYDDAGVSYHDPRVENLENAVPGIHKALAAAPLRENYQGIAIYCDWETSEAEWSWLRANFLRQPK